MKPLDINTTDFLKAILPFGIVITHYIPLYGYDTLLLGESIVAMFFFYVWIWVVDVKKEDNEVFGYTKGV